MCLIFCEHARNVRKVMETRGSSGGIFAVSCGCTTAENRGLNRISVKGVLLNQSINQSIDQSINGI